eukprot:764529-Hanusia_phi.AAC.3
MHPAVDEIPPEEQAISVARRRLDNPDGLGGVAAGQVATPEDVLENVVARHLADLSDCPPAGDAPGCKSKVDANGCLGGEVGLVAGQIDLERQKVPVCVRLHRKDVCGVSVGEGGSRVDRLKDGEGVVEALGDRDVEDEAGLRLRVPAGVGEEAVGALEHPVAPGDAREEVPRHPARARVGRVYPRVQLRPQLPVQIGSQGPEGHGDGGGGPGLRVAAPCRPLSHSPLALVQLGAAGADGLGGVVVPGVAGTQRADSRSLRAREGPSRTSRALRLPLEGVELPSWAWLAGFR